MLASYIIREMHITDLHYLHHMYDSLSEEDKRFFHPGFLGYKNISFWWLLSQIALFLSNIKKNVAISISIFCFSTFGCKRSK